MGYPMGSCGISARLGRRGDPNPRNGPAKSCPTLCLCVGEREREREIKYVK